MQNQSIGGLTMTRGQKISKKLEHVFVLLSAQRDEQATELLQQVFNDLQEVE
tara:strand:+ start:18 stop:173 length:156 start_codon:yes stop_codon:yes gene_type:complete